MKSELIEAVRALAKEKGLSEEMLFDTIENAIRTAYRKNLPKGAVEPANIVVNLNRQDGSIHVYARMNVVEEVTSPASQITLEEAHALRPRL